MVSQSALCPNERRIGPLRAAAHRIVLGASWTLGVQAKYADIELSSSSVPAIALAISAALITHPQLPQPCVEGNHTEGEYGLAL